MIYSRSLILSVLTGITVTFVGCNWEGPNISLGFERERIDLGGVSTGERLSRTFHFVNRTSEVVRVLRIQSDCGCITHHVESRVYAPGEGGHLHVDVDTSGLRAPAEFEKRLLVEYAVGKVRERRTLTIAGSVGMDMLLSSDIVDLATASNSSRLEGTILVKRGVLARRDFRTLNAATDDDAIRTRLNWTTHDECTVEVFASPEYRNSQGRILRLSYERNGHSQTVKLPLMRTVEGGQVEVRPHAYFAFVSTSMSPATVPQQTRKRMQLFHPSKANVRIVSVGFVDTACVRAEADPRKSNELLVWLEHLPKPVDPSELELDIRYCLGEQQEVHSVKLPCYLCVD